MAEVVDAGIFEAWLASTDDGAVAIDAAGRVVLHNPAASRVTGLAPNDARRRPWQDVLHLPAPIAALLWDVRITRMPTRTSAEVLCAQGNLRTAEITAHPWTDASGGVGVLILLRDLTILCRRRTGPGGRPGYGNLVGADPVMEALYDLIEAVAPSDAPVVIEGEPGTGKELVAQLIHARSRRAERPLVVVDCAALTPAMLEMELFGQTRTTAHGTGAVIGRLELAHTGSLLLDRMSDMPPSAQTRLLHLLETGTIERAGDPTPRRLDVRLIAASSRPLDQEAREGRLRPELVHRLQVIRIEIPPLRRRRGDIPLLAEHFLARHGPSGLRLSDAALSVLQACGVARQRAATRERDSPRIGSTLAHLRGAAQRGAAAGRAAEPRSIRAAPAARRRARGPAGAAPPRAFVARRKPHRGRARPRHRPRDLLPLVEGIGSRRGIGASPAALRCGRARPA